MDYKDLVNDIISAAEKQSASVKLPKRKLTWIVDLYIDMCHSGSAIDKA